MYESYDKGLEALYQGYYNTLNELVQRINNLVVDNARIKNLNVDKLFATDTKIDTALIEDLVVGGNVTMGPNATILWDQIEDVPEFDVDVTYADIIGPKPPTDANNTYSELLYNSGIRGFVNQSGTLYVSADYIRAGTMSANYIYGGTISSSVISVTSNARVGNNLFLGSGALMPAQLDIQKINFNPQQLNGFFRLEQTWGYANELSISAYNSGGGSTLASLNIGQLYATGANITGTISGTVSNASYATNAGYASSAGSIPWGSVSGKPSTFTPSSHSHSEYADVFLGGRSKPGFGITWSSANGYGLNVYEGGSYRGWLKLG